MANNNSNNNNKNNKPQYQKKQRDNYFKRQIKQFGVNFLEDKKSDALKWDVTPIFKDIAAGNIDIMTEGIYLTNKTLLDVCTSVAKSKVFYYQTIITGLGMLNSNLSAMTGTIPPETYHVYIQNSDSLKAWSLIFNACMYLYTNPDFPGILTSLINQLKPLRKNI